MKFAAVTALALASVAVAAPSPGHGEPKCKPATYRCSYHNGAPSWDTCNTSGVWVYSGNCPPGTVCKFFPPSQSPYCVPPSFQIP